MATSQHPKEEKKDRMGTDKVIRETGIQSYAGCKEIEEKNATTTRQKGKVPPRKGGGDRGSSPSWALSTLTQRHHPQSVVSHSSGVPSLV